MIVSSQQVHVVRILSMLSCSAISSHPIGMSAYMTVTALYSWRCCSVEVRHSSLALLDKSRLPTFPDDAQGRGDQRPWYLPDGKLPGFVRHRLDLLGRQDRFVNPSLSLKSHARALSRTNRKIVSNSVTRGCAADHVGGNPADRLHVQLKPGPVGSLNFHRSIPPPRLSCMSGFSVSNIHQ